MLASRSGVSFNVPGTESAIRGYHRYPRMTIRPSITAITPISWGGEVDPPAQEKMYSSIWTTPRNS
jgi:hypothetical protein